ncbi:cyclic nucleotide-binding domain-containing protein [Desulfobacterales bacterium HSG2]|nr:cyclic nucleotide-binding domain-containing protein [Desulfobacterales bacterium HSG2]
MNIKCKKCQAVFNLDNTLVKPKGIRVRCTKCRYVFEVYPPTFEIIKNSGCPLYKMGEEFQLLRNTFSPPHNKPPCLILVRDLIKIVSEKLPLSQSPEQKEKSCAGNKPGIGFTCSGCTGFIQFAYKTDLSSEDDNYTDALVSVLSRFPIFDSLGRYAIKEIVPFLKLSRFVSGDFILKKGDFGRFLFIILSGRVDVLDGDGMSIASMGKGDIFGEMSLLSGVPVGATIKVSETSAILRINGEDFRKVLTRHPTFLMNFIRLLIHRMSEINLSRMDEFVSGITGKLSEIPPSDLFQAFNVGEKTGVLTLKFPEKTAYLSFREGKLINVKYSEKEGEEAFFELLKQRKGRFKYMSGLSPEEMRASELGDFMGLLIEGLKRIDEEDKHFLRTVIPL